MVRIAPVRLAFNPKTLWFDAGDLELAVDQPVVVSTARGLEYGTMAKPVFDMAYEETKNLKSPLKPVKRVATEEDTQKFEELAEKSREALPVFKQMAAETVTEMNPVAVEYLFDGEKAVFYFESEDRVDFRDLVRKLAAHFHVRVDMKQIGVRDEARMIGGIGHCGQELCCRRLGGEFNPVSIRMAKEQDLSLNPQKISGTCGRLMCCLRYEYDAYKDFHTRAPKKNAKIKTPEGEGKVVDLDVPREIISIQVGTDKPVKIPLADMDPAPEGARPNSVGAEAWEKANNVIPVSTIDASALFSVELSGEDKLADRGKVHHVHEDTEKQAGKSRRRRSQGGSKAASSGSSAKADEQPAPTRKPRRRRSTTVTSDGTSKVTTVTQGASEEARSNENRAAKEAADQKQHSPRRRSRRGSAKKASEQNAQAQTTQGQSSQGQTKGKSSQVGRRSSGLRAGRAESGAQDVQGKPRTQDGGQAAGSEAKPQARRRRRRSHKAAGDQGATGQQAE